MQVRYQAALHPEKAGYSILELPDQKGRMREYLSFQNLQDFFELDTELLDNLLALVHIVFGIFSR